MPNPVIVREVKGVKISVRGLVLLDNKAAIGIGSLIIFIAMILVASVTASVMIQTMNNLEQQAMETGQKTIREVSSGVKITHQSGYSDGTNIVRLAIFVTTVAGSQDIDLNQAYISLSDGSNQVILSYDSTCFNSSASNGIFGTLNSTNISATEFGLIVVRDIDSSCSSGTPIINNDDLVVLLTNTTNCFSGIGKRTEVFGSLIPEYGINGVISFTTPSAYVDTIIDL